MMNRQLEQLLRNKKWVDEQGGWEGAQQLDTLLSDVQRPRFEWLKANVTGTILEVGCGWGYTLAYCRGHAGVDINPNLIELATLLAPHRAFTAGDARNLPVPANCFDTVTLPDVLEHLDWNDVPKAISEAVRVAKKRVLITIPDGRKDTEEAQCFKHKFLFGDKERRKLRHQLIPLVSNYYQQAVGLFVCLRGDL
ncbi:MAG: class I SAM-dependent methyltransferase [Candidatus Brocadiales bacterium]